MLAEAPQETMICAIALQFKKKQKNEMEHTWQQILHNKICTTFHPVAMANTRRNLIY